MIGNHPLQSIVRIHITRIHIVRINIVRILEKKPSLMTEGTFQSWSGFLSLQGHLAPKTQEHNGEAAELGPH